MLPGREISSQPSTCEVFLLDLLKAPLEIVHVEERSFPGGWRTPDGVTICGRYLLLLDGRLSYEVEGQTLEASAGMQLLVPGWIRRQWRVPRSHSCHLLWCEFTFTHFAGGSIAPPRWSIPLELGVEEAMFRRMLFQYPGRNSGDLARAVIHLHLEAELKASLARFWPGSRNFSGWDSITGREIHPWIRSALHWLDENYRRSEALDAFYRWLPASPNHFRLLFRQAGLGTVQNHLARLRLRHARYLIHETDLSLKEIAAETGYNDPLYFSRQYRIFWKHSPSTDRRAGKKCGDM